MLSLIQQLTILSREQTLKQVQNFKRLRLDKWRLDHIHSHNTFEKSNG